MALRAPPRWQRALSYMITTAPWNLSLMMVILFLGLLLRPETVLILPIRLMGLAQCYASYVFDRLVARAEHEISNVLFGGGDPPPINSQPASSVTSGPQRPELPAAIYQTSTLSCLGWLAAMAAYLRQ